MKQQELIQSHVKIREKTVAGGCKSLYLDIYFEGKRRKEYLKLYLVDARTPAQRQQNADILRLAQATRAKRELEVCNGEYTFGNEDKVFKQMSKTPLFDYIRALREEYRREGKSYMKWDSLLTHLEEFCVEKTRLCDVTPDFLEGFKKYLDNVEIKPRTNPGPRTRPNPKPRIAAPVRYLSLNTKGLYFNQLRMCINRAYKDGLIEENPVPQVKRFPVEETHREHLTVEELRKMAAAPCGHDVFKRAFLFACLTGLRKCDVKKLTWGEVDEMGEFTRISFRQQKTSGFEYQDLNPQAVEFMGLRRGADNPVFAGFPRGNKTIKKYLDAWCAAAGITKKITFHCARHTFAIMMFELGGDIYTVSKLLGHKDVLVTQVYAKVLDGRKREMISRIPDFGVEKVKGPDIIPKRGRPRKNTDLFWTR